MNLPILDLYPHRIPSKWTHDTFRFMCELKKDSAIRDRSSILAHAAHSGSRVDLVLACIHSKHLSKRYIPQPR